MQQLNVFSKAKPAKLHRWIFSILSCVFALLAVFALLEQWPNLIATIEQGVWTGKAYLFILMFTTALGIALWCLKLSGFDFDGVENALRVIGVLFLGAVVLTILFRMPSHTLAFVPFVLMLFLLIASFLLLRKIAKKNPGFSILSAIYPLISLAGLILLFDYAYHNEETWVLQQDSISCLHCDQAAVSDNGRNGINEETTIMDGSDVESHSHHIADNCQRQYCLSGWISAGYLILILLPALFLLSFKKYFSRDLR